MSPTTTEFSGRVELPRFSLRQTHGPWVWSTDGSVAAVGSGIGERTPVHRGSLSEELLHAYCETGADVTRHLVGQYCGVVVDARRRRVLLLQDSLGVRTAFYQQTQRELRFASSLGCLVTDDCGDRIDRTYAEEFLSIGPGASDRTPFPSTRRLLNGATVIWEEDGSYVRYPWTPRDVPPIAVNDQDEAASTLVMILKDALRPMVGASRPVLCDVSAGLDSTTVYVAAKETGVPVEPFSVVSRGVEDDGDTRLLDQLLGTTRGWHVIDVETALPFSARPTGDAYEPGGEVGLAMRQSVNKVRAKSGAHIGLSGMGGDQVFGAMDSSPLHLADTLQAARLVGLLGEAREWAARHVESRPAAFWIWNYAVRPLWAHMLSRRLDEADPEPSWLCKVPRVSGKHGRQRHFHRQPSCQRLWEQLYHAAAVEAAGVSHSSPCPYYFPLMHRPLVEFMAGLPWRLRRLPSEDRVLQRAAMKGLLPESVRGRTSKGTGQGSFDRAFANATDWHALLARGRLSELGFVDRRRWADAVERGRFGLFESLPSFCATASLEAWLQGSVGSRLR